MARSSFTPATVPESGEYNSETALIDSTVPRTSAQLQVDYRPIALFTSPRCCPDHPPLRQRRRGVTRTRVIRAAYEPLSRLSRPDDLQLSRLADGAWTKNVPGGKRR